jgi:hypothetical protein
MADERASLPNLRYEDRSDLLETFADSIGPCSFDGQSVRLEFTVTRFDPGNPGQAQSGRRIPVARLALTLKGAVELLNQCHQLTLAFEKAGLLKDKPSTSTAKRS